MIEDLTPEEQEIENAAEETRPVTAERRKAIERIVERSKKTEAISLRLSRIDLDLAKKRATEEGLPYQTLITSIIHKYVTDRLYDRDEVQRLLGEIEKRKAM